MKIKTLFFPAIFVIAFSSLVLAQNLKQTTTKTEHADLGAGGTVTIVGAPEGSISIEGWQQPNVEVTAEISTEAPTTADLAFLTKVNTFTFEDETNHVRILTTGTHDKQFIKKNFKKFPKNLLAMPWRIDYKIKVPNYCDLEIDAGHGNFDLRGVDGTIVIKALQSDRANLDLVGGFLKATFGGDEVNVKLNARGWRGQGVDIQVAHGTLNITAPPALNSDLDLSILRTGKIENKFENFKPRNKTKFSETSMLARAGSGGATLAFAVGDGTLRIAPQ